MCDARDVLRDIDQLRRDLSGYHGQLKAHNDLQRHCDNQRARIAELEGIHARDKEVIAELREWCAELLMMAESNDPEWLHWPEMLDELEKLGVDVK